MRVLIATGARRGLSDKPHSLPTRLFASHFGRTVSTESFYFSLASVEVFRGAAGVALCPVCTLNNLEDNGFIEDTGNHKT